MSVAIYSFQLFLQDIFFTIIPIFPQYAFQSLKQNSKWILHQDYGNKANSRTMMERHFEEKSGEKKADQKIMS